MSMAAVQHPTEPEKTIALRPSHMLLSIQLTAAKSAAVGSVVGSLNIISES